MMDKFRELVDSARVAFGRLTQREQLMVVGVSGMAGVVLLLVIGALVSSAITREQHRVKVKTEQLMQVLALQGEYKTRQLERKQRLDTLGRSNVRLVSLVEDSAKQTGVDIGQLRPEDGDPSSDGVIESRVDLRASGLSADRLMDFLIRLEQAQGIVVVRRLKVDKPYRRDTADIEMSISTFKLKGT